MKKFTKITTLVLMLTIAFTLGVFSDSINQQITVLLNKTVNITFDGKPVELKDAHGARVYPITYNGTTYLPARAICDLTKTGVNWDGKTNTVILGDANAKKEPTQLIKQKKASKYESDSYLINDTVSLSFEGSDGIQEFNSGVGLKWDGVSETRMVDTLMFDIEGYNELTFTVGCKIDEKEDSDIGESAQLLIFDEEGNKITNLTVKNGQLITTTVKLNGVKKIGFGGIATKRFYDRGTLYIYDPMLK